ncbi:MAG TPA: NUDIX domain-containing protein [Gaiellales bacterium]|nr:NUDIX domain-containing protein [Gaiellales bacterium]
MRRSAGLLLYRTGGREGLEVLLAHMGGPLWASRDAGAWSIPKGEHDGEEEPLDAAIREFAEELGSPPPPGRPMPLGEVRQTGGKRVTAFALRADFDAGAARSATFEMEWPPRSGRMRWFPEIDRAAWMPVARARKALVPAQREFLDRLHVLIDGPAAPASVSRGAAD